MTDVGTTVVLTRRRRRGHATPAIVGVVVFTTVVILCLAAPLIRGGPLEVDLDNQLVLVFSKGR